MTRAHKKRKPAATQQELTVTALGARGEGIAETDRGRVFLPFTLPGDRVIARVSGDHGTVAEFREKAPRQEPACPHFGICGGCLLQDMPEADYRDWKRQRVADALAKKGFADPPVAAPTVSPPRSRRRTVLSFKRHGKGMALGYHVHRRHRIVDITVCPIVTPAIEALIGPLRAALTDLSWPTGRIMITETETGIELVFAGIDTPGLENREALAAFAEAQDLARICISESDMPATDAEPVVIRRQPTVRFGTRDVALPPAAFLQATKEGEAALTEAVLDWAEGPTIADLFAGCGTFSIPLSHQARVHAVDADAILLAALTAAFKGGAHTSEARDLFTAPLLAKELSGFDAVLFDPPRAGAKAQAEALAGSAVPGVIAVSCNPATFARDARILADGGYAMREVRPVDQFLWSPHVELAALFVKE